MDKVKPKGTSEKRFGNLSADQVVKFFKFGRSVVLGQSQLSQMVGEDKSAYTKIFPRGPTWAALYFIPFKSLAALVYYRIGALWTVHNMASAPDPQAAALALMENFDPALSGRSEPTPEERIRAIESLVALENCWRCISYYSVTMCDVAQAGLLGNADALKIAAIIDPSIFWSPPWAPVVAAMAIEREREFFREIGLYALRTEQKREQSRMLRIAEFVLHDAGAFEVASRDEMLDLIARRLRMRSDLGENPAKALSELFRRCRIDRDKVLGGGHANP